MTALLAFAEPARAQDSDSDGIPDAYEDSTIDGDPQTLDLNKLEPADAPLDFDQDGYSNLAEYLQGSDIRDRCDPACPPTIELSVDRTWILGSGIVKVSWLVTDATRVRFEPDIGSTSLTETDYEVPITAPIHLMLIAENDTSYASDVIQIDYYEEHQANTYDTSNARVLEKNETSETIFVYGPSGELLSELDAAGAPVVEYFYLEGEPIAQIRGAVGGGAASRRWVHNSHLGTPERLTDATRATVWEIQSEPFGEVYDVTADPGETQRGRFPGQLADQATNLNYNWHRYYDP